MELRWRPDDHQGDVFTFSTRVLQPVISLWLAELSNDVGAQTRNSSSLRLEQTELALGRLVKFVDSEEIRFSYSRDDDRRSLELHDSKPSV